MAAELSLLRPLSVADILDSTFTLYRRHFGELVSIAAVVQIPLGLLQAARRYYLPQTMPGGGRKCGSVGIWFER
jgi:hypothetical protein